MSKEPTRMDKLIETADGSSQKVAEAALAVGDARKKLTEAAMSLTKAENKLQGVSTAEPAAAVPATPPPGESPSPE